MAEKKQTYLEQQLEARIHRENDTIAFAFQKEKIKLDNRVEIDMLKELDSGIHRDITLNEDELIITVRPEERFHTFRALKEKDGRSTYIFAHQLVKKVKAHSLTRIHLIVCPENIVFDESLTPSFLHYGVKESIPPYEKDKEKLWQELKAATALAIDGKYTFQDYLKFHETLDLSPQAKQILASKNEDELLEWIEQQIKSLDEKDKTFVSIPQNKWKVTRYVAIGLLAGFIPALLYTLYSLFFLEPKQEAFVSSNEHFLGSDYSEVVEVLADYEADEMPDVVQYQLASSYIKNAKLTEEQKEQVTNTVTLQTDPQYYSYWIHIGRGEGKKALDIARDLEDRDLIVYGLLEYRNEIKADDELSSEEKQKLLKEVQAEIDEYEQEQQALIEEEERKEEEKRQAEQQLEEQRKLEEEKKTQEEAAAAEAEKDKTKTPAPAGGNE
ncbi:type VII secretion protein EssB [Fictibacillus aquaticus]|uniref:Type VII secretion protein EssB n=1 Tax=Fictibacillus aquaticus TaxID=2021314 RepID=A0A235F5G4_9BACL|nr:type VII secretion protein EssB [Fictibacillus aquaticus]OYD56546.1 type VII secretion protein EssB [Fictibacillus aquaticus]